VVWLAVTRASACLSYLGILLILALLSLLVLGIGMALGAGHDPLVLGIAVGVGTVPLTAGVWDGLRGLLTLPGLVHFALDAAFYAGVVPFLVTLADVLGDALRVPTAWDMPTR
jgi:hypothetical protein